MIIEELTAENLNKAIRETVETEEFPETSLVASQVFDGSNEALAILGKSLALVKAGLPMDTALICAAVAFFRAGMTYATQEREATAAKYSVN